jgi:hypothetical protein
VCGAVLCCVVMQESEVPQGLRFFGGVCECTRKWAGGLRVKLKGAELRDAIKAEL